MSNPTSPYIMFIAKKSVELKANNNLTPHTLSQACWDHLQIEIEIHKANKLSADKALYSLIDMVLSDVSKGSIEAKAKTLRYRFMRA